MTTRGRTWRSALAAVAVAWLAACGGEASAGSPGAVVTAATTAVAAARPDDTASSAATTAPAPTTAPPAPAPKVPIGRTLFVGVKGDDVLRLQQRLNELRFDVGKPDGYFGQKTQWAVWAYQALVLGLRGKAVDGYVSPALWNRIQDPLGLSPQREHATPNRIEVFLPAQAAVFYQDNAVRVITHISSGSGEEWCAEPKVVKPYPAATTTTLPPGKRLRRTCGHSITPGGAYTIYRKEPGWWEIPLGKVYNPLYFNRGIAIHGFDEVPKTAASHGCIRIPMHISEYVFDIYKSGDAVFVFDGEQEPEAYGAQAPPEDTPDPTDLGDEVWPPVPAAEKAAAEKAAADAKAATTSTSKP